MQKNSKQNLPAIVKQAQNSASNKRFMIFLFTTVIMLSGVIVVVSNINP